ncbi:unnamed protein product [Adineta ricciae]|uniref:Uncharacterized protein n=1 Tax=Adineta ricciae TaxID=249248 RepID=A0A814XRI7_ADIRI|nr:unnamed protein product [Adineta ricciae]
MLMSLWEICSARSNSFRKAVPFLFDILNSGLTSGVTHIDFKSGVTQYIDHRFNYRATKMKVINTKKEQQAIKHKINRKIRYFLGQYCHIDPINSISVIGEIHRQLNIEININMKLMNLLLIMN